MCLSWKSENQIEIQKTKIAKAIDRYPVFFFKHLHSYYHTHITHYPTYLLHLTSQDYDRKYFDMIHGMDEIRHLDHDDVTDLQRQTCQRTYTKELLLRRNKHLLSAAILKSSLMILPTYTYFFLFSIEGGGA